MSANFSILCAARNVREQTSYESAQVGAGASGSGFWIATNTTSNPAPINSNRGLSGGSIPTSDSHVVDKRLSPFHQLVRSVSRVRQGDGPLFSSSHRSRPALLNDNLQDLEAEAKALARKIAAAKKARLK